MNKYLKLFVAGLLLSSSVTGMAQSNTIGQNVNQTAVPFLRVSPDARSGGMGDVGLAISPDANSVFWNSAKLPFTDADSGIGLSYTPWLANLDVKDIHLINIGGYTKLDDEQAISGSIKYFSLGETQFRESLLEVPVTANPQEFAIQAGYSRALSDVVGLGVNLKYINSNLVPGQARGNTKVGSAVAGDVNFYYNPVAKGNADWSFASTITNLGSKISYTESGEVKDFLPTNLGLGANVKLDLDEINKVSFALDANKLLVPTPDTSASNPLAYKNKSVIGSIFSSFGDAPGGASEELKEVNFSLGGEYDYNDQFFGRAGYFYENDEKGGRQYATLGAGFKYNVTNFNFAYLFATGNSNNPLDKTLRFSLDFDINKK